MLRNGVWSFACETSVLIQIRRIPISASSTSTSTISCTRTRDVPAWRCAFEKISTRCRRSLRGGPTRNYRAYARSSAVSRLNQRHSSRSLGMKRVIGSVSSLLFTYANLVIQRSIFRLKLSLMPSAKDVMLNKRRLAANVLI